MEMSKEQLVTRLLSSESEIEHTKLRTGTLSRAEWPKLAEAAGRLTDALMFIDDSPSLSVLELRARARRLRRNMVWDSLWSIIFNSCEEGQG